MLPPGWITAVAPAASAASSPSANGKKASEATTLPTVPRGPAGRDGCLGRLAHRDRDAVEPAHLAGADADRGAAFGEHDRVRLDVLADREGKAQVGKLGRRRRPLGHHS